MSVGMDLMRRGRINKDWIGLGTMRLSDHYPCTWPGTQLLTARSVCIHEAKPLNNTKYITLSKVKPRPDLSVGHYQSKNNNYRLVVVEADSTRSRRTPRGRGGLHEVEANTLRLVYY